MPLGRRLTSLLVALALVALPAVALRAICIGQSCRSGEAAAGALVPFCSLPAHQRSLIAAGFHQDRSPDVMAATADRGPGVRASVEGSRLSVLWPSAFPADTRVPVVFFGAGFSGQAPSAGTGLDQIAPTLATAMGLLRPHPEVRSGVAAEGVAIEPKHGEAGPSLVVPIVWKGVGTPDLERRPASWPYLGSLLERGHGTMQGSTRSIPLDPAATITTIGTGGLPGQHGIVGGLYRGEGGVVDAWGPDGPGSVIATLGDDLDESTDHRAFVGAVLSDRSDQGVIGDGWYLGSGGSDPVVVTHEAVGAVGRMLAGVGEGSVHGGMLGVVLQGSIAEMDRATEAIVRTVRTSIRDAAFVVTASGTLHGRGLQAAIVRDDIQGALGPVVQAVGSGGFFLDRPALAVSSITAARVAEQMREVKDGSAGPLFADAFPSFAVAFSRFC